MAIAFRSTVREFVAPSDSHLPPEQQTVWLLGPLDVFDSAELADSYSVDPDKWAVKSVQMVRLALRGWKNLKDADGKEVAFVGLAGRASDEDMRKIPYSIVLELLLEVNRFEQIARAQVGESLPQRT